MKIEGTTDTIPLRELIEMISYSSVTGALNLYAHQEVAGHLYFRDGHLYHCDFAASSGVEALAGLFELGHVGFSFVSDATCEQESLWGDMDYHVRIAERLAYRWQHARPIVTSLDLTPVLLIAFDAAMRRVGPAHHQLLDRIDGQHSLRAIVADLGWAAIDVAEAVAQMSRDGLLDLRAAAQPPQPAIGAARGGMFDRLLSRSGEAPREHSAEELILHVLRS